MLSHFLVQGLRGGAEVQFSNLQSGHLQKSIEAQGKGMAASLVCKSRRRLQTWAKRFTTKFDVDTVENMPPTWSIQLSSDK